MRQLTHIFLRLQEASTWKVLMLEQQKKDLFAT